jgi:hypothetical protein
VRLTIWQFVGVVVALVGLYLVYNYWWLDQDRNSWIRKFNDSVYSSEKELEESAEPEKKEDSWL